MEESFSKPAAEQKKSRFSTNDFSQLGNLLEEKADKNINKSYDELLQEARAKDKLIQEKKAGGASPEELDELIQAHRDLLKQANEMKKEEEQHEKVPEKEFVSVNKTLKLVEAIDENIRKKGYTEDYLADLSESQLKQLLGELEKRGDDKNYLVVEKVLGRKNPKFTGNSTFLENQTESEAKELPPQPTTMDLQKEIDAQINGWFETRTDEATESLPTEKETDLTQKQVREPEKKTFMEHLRSLEKDKESVSENLNKTEEEITTEGGGSLEEDTNVSKKYAIDRTTSSEDLARYRKELEDELETIQEDNHPRLTEIDGLLEQIKVYENAYNLGLPKDARDKVILEYENPEDPFVRKSKTNKKTEEIMDLAKQIQEEEKSDTDHIAEGLKKQLDDKKAELESKQTQPKSDAEMKNILEQRRFGHTKQLFEGFAKSNEKNKEHYEKLQRIFSKKYEELSESEQKLVRSINFKDFINEKKTGKESLEKITLKKEALEILGKRVRNLEDQMMKQEGKNFLQRGWKRFSSWYENPDNKRKLRKRALVSAGVTAFLTTTGAGFLVALGVSAAKFAGSYAGGETTRWLYDRNKKDYRQRMADFRRGFEKDPGQLAEKKDIEESILENYKKRRNELMASSAGYIQNKNKWRERWDTIGRVVGGLSIRGIEELLSETENLIPENTAPESVEIPVETPIENQETLGISKDAYINKGEGITHALLRQLRANPDLRTAFGIEGNATGADAARVARAFGYINDDGSEVRVLWGEGAAYELTLDENGNPIVREHKGGAINGDLYEGGEKVERHMKGAQFEGQNIEKEYEYLYSKDGQRSLGGSGEHTYLGDLESHRQGHTYLGPLEGERTSSGNLFSQERFPGREYKGLINLQIGTFDERYNRMFGDASVRDLFEQHGIAFTQENFEKLGFRPDFEGGPRGKNFINIYDPNGQHYGWKEIYENFDIENAKKLYFDQKVIEGSGHTYLGPGNENIAQGLEQERVRHIGPFEVVYDDNGNVERHYLDDHYEFQGPIDNEAFSDREVRLIEKGKFSTRFALDGRGTHLVQLKNGQYALETFGTSEQMLGAQNAAEEGAKGLLENFGMRSSEVRYFQHQALESGEGHMTRAYVPLSKKQAEFIAATYADLSTALGQR